MVASVSQRKRLSRRTKRFSPAKKAQSRTATSESWIAAEMTPRSSASSAESLSLPVMVPAVRRGARRRRANLSSSLQPLDLGTAGGELLLQPLVAAVEVVDAVQGRLARRRKACDRQRHR